MKPTQKQIELIKTIEGIVSSWASTNDISSPTHYSDMGELLQPFVIDCDRPEGILILSEIEAGLGHIFQCVKDLEKKPLTKEEKLTWLNNLRNDRENKKT